MEAEDFVPEQEQTTLPLKCSIPKKTCSLKSNITTKDLSQEAQETIEFNPETKELTVTAVVPPEVEEEILGLVSNEEDKEAIKTAIAQQRAQTEEIFQLLRIEVSHLKFPLSVYLFKGNLSYLIRIQGSLMLIGTFLITRTIQKILHSTPIVKIPMSYLVQ